MPGYWSVTAEGLEIGNASAVLDALIRHSGECVHVVDLDGRIVRWNASCEAVYGWSAKDVLGEVLPIVSPERRRRVLRDIRLLAGAEHVTERMGVAERPDGSKLHVHMSVVPIHDLDGDPCAVAVISHEVLEDDRFERMRDDLIAYVGHRLTGPLNVIANATALLVRSEGLDDAANRRRLAKAVHAQARDVQAFVDDLLATTLTAEGKLTLDREPVDLGELVAAAIAESGGAAGRITLEFDPLVGPVFVDRKRLGRAFREIVKGAVRLCGERGVIRVSISGHDDVTEVSVAMKGVKAVAVQDMFGAEGVDARVTRRLVTGIIEAHGGEVLMRDGGIDTSVCAIVLPTGPPEHTHERHRW